MTSYAIKIKDGFNESVARMNKVSDEIEALAKREGTPLSFCQAFKPISTVVVDCDEKLAKKIKKMPFVASIKADI